MITAVSRCLRRLRSNVVVARPRRLRAPDPVAGERSRRMVKEIVKAEMLTGYYRRRQRRTVCGARPSSDRPYQRATLSYIFAVGNSQLFRLVTSQFDGPPNVGRYDALVATLVQ